MGVKAALVGLAIGLAIDPTVVNYVGNELLKFHAYLYGPNSVGFEPLPLEVQGGVIATGVVVPLIFAYIGSRI